MSDIVERLRDDAMAWINNEGDYSYIGNRLFAAALEIERLRATVRELDEAIRELQQAACDRAGVPMPSQRPK